MQCWPVPAAWSRSRVPGVKAIPTTHSCVHCPCTGSHLHRRHAERLRRSLEPSRRLAGHRSTADWMALMRLAAGGKSAVAQRRELAVQRSSRLAGSGALNHGVVVGQRDEYPRDRPLSSRPLKKTGSQATPQSVGSRAARAVARQSFASTRTMSWSTASAGAPAAGPTLDLDPLVLWRAACGDIPQLRQRSNGPLTRTDGGPSGRPAALLTFW